MSRQESLAPKRVEPHRPPVGTGSMVLVSNRGPLEYRIGEGGRLAASRGQGGLVSALTPLAERSGAVWVAAAMGEGDRQAALKGSNGELPVVTDDGRFWQRFVLLPPEVYHQHYNVFSNPLVWFLQHGLWGVITRPNLEEVTIRAWQEGYVPANRAFAEAVVAAVGQQRAPTVMLHDYHLYLVAALVRERLPRARLHQFVHIPWPEPRTWGVLPLTIRQAICAGLAANDVVGFQTQESVVNFLRTCRRFLPQARVDEERGTVQSPEGHTAHVRAYPISIDVDGLRRVAVSAEVRGYRQRLAGRCGEQTIVRVDRLDPSKNVALGFRAFALLLRQRPELVGRVKLLSFLVPSRTGVPEYQRYADETMGLVQTLNRTYQRDGWQPIEVFYENNYPQAMAGLQLYDVLLVNSVADGMNLVAKEGPIVNRQDGVLVLSRAAGAHEQLKAGALSVSPLDVEGTAEALGAALAMPAAERRWRAERLRSVIEREDLQGWVARQMADLQSLGVGGQAWLGPQAPAALYQEGILT